VTDQRYELRFRPAALRQLRKLDTQIARRIKGATEALRVEPRPPGVKALTGQRGWLRIRAGTTASYTKCATASWWCWLSRSVTGARSTIASHRMLPDRHHQYPARPSA
jgi:hypothetical protein